MANPIVGTDNFGNPIDANGVIVLQPGVNVAVGRNMAGYPIDAQGNVVTQPGRGFGKAPVASENLTPAGHPNYPPVTITVSSVEDVSISLPKGASVNSNGTVILADGTPLNINDVIRAWRNAQTHV